MFASTILWGQTAATETGGVTLPGFEVASVRQFLPGSVATPSVIGYPRVHLSGIRLKDLIFLAFNVKESQIEGAPKWTETDHYDIDATTPDNIRGLPVDQQTSQIQLMFRELLANRFGLRYHLSVRKSDVYSLESAANTPEVLSHPVSAPATDGDFNLKMPACTMAQLASVLASVLSMPVIDRTGIQEKHDISLRWARNEDSLAASLTPAQGQDAGGLSLQEALRKDLGLKLVRGAASVNVIVIDHIGSPSPN